MIFHLASVMINVEYVMSLNIWSSCSLFYIKCLKEHDFSSSVYTNIFHHNLLIVLTSLSEYNSEVKLCFSNVQRKARTKEQDIAVVLLT